MNEEQKLKLNHEIQDKIKLLESHIKYTTKNIQYQNWLCKLLKNEKFLSIYMEDSLDIEYYYGDYKKLLQHYDIVKQYEDNKKLKDINSFNNISELEEYVNQKVKECKPAIRKKNQKKNISQIFYKEQSIGSYDIYRIEWQSKEEFQQIYGDNGYDCAWCVTDPEEGYFSNYTERGWLYLITYANSSKPFGLLFIEDCGTDIEFKDIHNIEFTEYDDTLSKIVYDRLSNYFDIESINQVLSVYDEMSNNYQKQIEEQIYGILLDDSIYKECYKQELKECYKILNNDHKKQLLKRYINMKDEDGSKSSKGINIINQLIDQFDFEQIIDDEIIQMCKKDYPRFFFNLYLSGFDNSEYYLDLYIKYCWGLKRLSNYAKKHPDHLQLNEQQIKILLNKKEFNNEQMNQIIKNCTLKSVDAQEQALKYLNDQYNKGLITKEEIEQIKSNW